MIIKILPFKGRSTDGAIDYNSKKENEFVEEFSPDEVDDILNRNKKTNSKLLAIENTVDDIGVFRRALNEINSQGRVGEPLFHVSINFPPAEEVEEDLLLQIASDYMTDMGYGDQPYAVWEHSDCDHKHIHIVSTRVDRNTFKKIKDSHENLRSMKLAELYEKRYGLQLVKHTRGREVKPETIGVRSDLDKVMEKVLKQRPHSMAILKEMLEEHNIVVKEGSEKQIFFVKQDNNGADGRLFASSKLNAFAKKNVRQRLNINRVIRNKYRSHIKDVVGQLLNHYGPDGIDTRQFGKELSKLKIYVSYEENRGGIYGVQFNYRGFELKGSDVDKSLSWNILKMSIYPAPPPQKVEEIPSKKKQQMSSGSSILPETLRGALGNLFQGLSGSDGEDDDEEEKKKNRKNIPRH